MTQFTRTTFGQTASIGPVVDHHSIMRDNGHYVAWETFADATYGTDYRYGGREKVIPNACPVAIVYDKVRKADVIVSMEAVVGGTLPAASFDAVTVADALWVATIGPVLEHAKNNAMNGVGVMRSAGLYENLLHGVDAGTGKLPSAIRTAMLNRGFYFAHYRDVRAGV